MNSPAQSHSNPFHFQVSTSDNLENLSLSPQQEGPLDVVLMRHAESEGNVLNRMLDAGEVPDELREKFLKTPNNLLRLSERGIEQRDMAGAWFKEHMSHIPLHRFMVSYYIRAEETAAGFALAAGLEDVQWYQTSLVGERHWGDFDKLPSDMREGQYALRAENSRLWTPVGGESLRELEGHARDLFSRMHEKYSGKGVMVVSHGEFITSMSSLVERWGEARLNRAISDGVPNCGILHYSRVNPTTGEIEPHLNWVRRISPALPNFGKGWDGEWRRIERPKPTSSELLEHVRTYPQLLGNLEK